MPYFFNVSLSSCAFGEGVVDVLLNEGVVTGAVAIRGGVIGFGWVGATG